MFDIENDIRIADTGDFQELFRICCLLHQEIGIHSFSEEKVSRLVWDGCRKDNAMIGVVGPSDNIKAMIYLSVQEPYYSTDNQLVELWNYTRQDSRKTDYAKKLIIFAKKCSEETGLILSIGIMSDKRLEAKSRLYGRLLPIGGTFFIFRPMVSAAADGQGELA